MFKSNNTDVTVQVLQKCVPSIIINPDALTKMQLYVDECADEIGWLGIGYRDEATNVILITDVFLFDQEVHSTTTEISPEGLGEFGEQLLQTEEGMEIWNNLKVWGHSHVNMGVSPSKTDDEQMEIFADNGHDWFVRIIANKKGDLRVDLYYYDQGIIYNNLPWRVHVTKKEKEIEEQIQKLYAELETYQNTRVERFKEDIIEEMKQKVKKKTYKNNNIYQYQYGYDSKYWEDYYEKDIREKYQIKDEKAEENEKDDIKNADDVYNFFNEVELFDIGACKTIDEVKEELRENGLSPEAYSFSELSYVWTEGRRIFYAINHLNEEDINDNYS